MNTQYLNKYNPDVGLIFKTIWSGSDESEILHLFNMLKQFEKNQNQLIGQEENLVIFDLFMEKIQDDRWNFYIVYKDDILYSYIKAVGEKHIYILSFFSSNIKIVQNITYLLLDYVIFDNIEEIKDGKLILPDEFEATNQHFEKWLKFDKIYEDIQSEWGVVKNPNLTKRYSSTVNNLQYKIGICFKRWKEIFPNNIIFSNEKEGEQSIQELAQKAKAKSASIKSPEYEKETMEKFEHIKFFKEQNQTVVCKTPREDSSVLPTIREIIYYKNLDYPHIPKISKINNGEFCLPKYYPLKITEDNIKEFMKQMLMTLDYVHSKGICHQDVKPINMLQDKNGRYYLIDFGMAQFYGFNGIEKFYSSTHGFEIENLNFNNNLNVDIFSFGISIIQIITGHPSYYYRIDEDDFYYETSTDVMNMLPGLKSTLIENLGDTGYDLLMQMLNLCSASEALNHKYFNKKYTPIAIDFSDIIPFVNIELYDFFKYRHYKLAIESILDVCIESNYTYITFLLIIQIFRRIIVLKLIKTSNEVQLYASSCILIASAINEDEMKFFIEMEYYTNNKYNEKQIQDNMFKVLKELDYKVELIPYDYYVKDKDLFKLIWVLTFYEGKIDLNLKQLSDNINEYYKNPNKYKYDKNQTKLENIKNQFDIS